MVEDIYEPLSEYIEVFAPRFREVSDSTFAELAEEACVDVDANRETCRQIYSEEDRLSSVETSIRWWIFLCVLLCVVFAGGIAVEFMDTDNRVKMASAAGMAVVAALQFVLVIPGISSAKSERNRISGIIDGLKNVAWEQMAPLNRLYDWDILTRMMSRTVPRLEFDPYFTTQRLADLKATYGWNDSFNSKRSVLYSHSGLINGNPFVICRTKKMEMGRRTYSGSKTISWTTTERDLDGKPYTAHHSETLTAEVTAPYPEYYEKTRVIYGNTAAPDLVFNRKKSNLAGNESSSAYRRTRRQLRKLSRDLKGADYAMMTNEEFEVAFDTRDRSDNRQFAIMFTPLAQENMLKLLKDRRHGYGDDFDFNKKKMISTIIPDHLQCLDLDMDPEQYRHFDYDKAAEGFRTMNSKHFRAIYFSLAPLLCVPVFQQVRPPEAIYGRDMRRQSCFWEHEALANFWGAGRFRHPSCVTDCILKTEQEEGEDGVSTITVSAHGYRRVERVTYVKCWGGDGREHQVPVYWDEYLSVTGKGSMTIRDDGSFDDLPLSQNERLGHIDNLLGQNNMDVYRRHIASRV